MSVQPRFAIAFWLTSVTLMPTISATVNGLQTMHFPNSLAFAYSSSKCSGWVFIVRSVNQMLSVCVIVRPGRCSYTSPIVKTDNIWFTLLTMNTHPLHFDEEYAKASEFGKCIVCSPFTVALIVGMSVTDVSQKAIANLGWTDIKLTHPVFAGDTLYAYSEVLDKRDSKSRPGAGLVSVRTVGTNQDGTEVCTFNRTMLIAKRGHSVEDKVNY